MVYAAQRIGSLFFVGMCSLEIDGMGRKRAYHLIDMMRNPFLVFAEKKDPEFTEEDMIEVIKQYFPDFPDN